MSNKNIFCFSGQGSNYYHMGKRLYDQGGIFKKWMDELDEIVRSLINVSVLSVLYDDNKKIGDVFNRTLYTHPAIFMVEYSMFKVLEDKNVYPDYVFGYSLGEFTSSVVSGIISYEEALKMIIKHADLIEKKCEESSMLAILYNMNFFYELKTSFPDIELASINNKNHFVIAGTNSSLNKISSILKERQIIYQFLPVSHAFHSSLIDPAADDFKDYLKLFIFNEPSITYISCERADFLNDTDTFSNDYYWDITRNPILLQDTILFIERSNTFNYIDLGPSGTIINFIKMNLRSDSKSQLYVSLNPFGGGLNNLNKIIAEL